MTVRVQQPASLQTVDILCTVRALLKKMQERVLVGDDVRLISIDWIDLRGRSRLTLSLIVALWAHAYLQGGALPNVCTRFSSSLFAITSTVALVQA